MVKGRFFCDVRVLLPYHLIECFPPLCLSVLSSPTVGSVNGKCLSEWNKAYCLEPLGSAGLSDKAHPGTGWLLWSLEATAGPRVDGRLAAWSASSDPGQVGFCLGPVRSVIGRVGLTRPPRSVTSPSCHWEIYCRVQRMPDQWLNGLQGPRSRSRPLVARGTLHPPTQRPQTELGPKLLCLLDADHHCLDFEMRSIAKAQYCEVSQHEQLQSLFPVSGRISMKQKQEMESDALMKHIASSLASVCFDDRETTGFQEAYCFPFP